MSGVSADDPALLHDVLVAGGAWDRYWGAALAGALDTCLAPSSNWRRLPGARVSRLSAEDMLSETITYNAVTGQRRGIGLFVPGAAIANKRVVVLGCGYGELSRQLLPWTDRLLGVDLSRLVLLAARAGARSRRLRYGWIGDDDLFRDLAGTFDTLVSQYFFFHLNLRLAVGVLGRAGRLLRRGGLATLEVCTHAPGSVDGRVREASAGFDRRRPTTGYRYTEAQMEELARSAGFRIDAGLDIPGDGRRLLRLIRDA